MSHRHSFLIVLLLPFVISMPGGWFSHDIESLSSDESYSKIVDFLLKNISSTSTEEKWSFDFLLSYETQVVAGINHKLVLQIKNTVNTRKVIFAVIFEPLFNEPFILSKYLEIITNSNKTPFFSVNNNDELIDLKNKAAHVHEYYSNEFIQYHIKKIRWAVKFNNIYYLNYELEGTNNEISLWEHWMKKTENKDALEASLIFFKLPIGKFLYKEFVNEDKSCDLVESYIICGLSQCDTSSFLTEGKCK